MNKTMNKTLCKIELGYSGQILATPAIAAKLVELLAQTTIVENEWTGDGSVRSARHCLCVRRCWRCRGQRSCVLPSPGGTQTPG